MIRISGLCLLLLVVWIEALPDPLNLEIKLDRDDDGAIQVPVKKKSVIPCPSGKLRYKGKCVKIYKKHDSGPYVRKTQTHKLFDMSEPSYEKEYQRQRVIIQCPNGKIWKKDRCVPKGFDNSERPYWRANQLLVQRNLDTTECPTGYMQIGNECVKNDKVFDMLEPSYEKEYQRQRVIIQCPNGKIWKKDRCVPKGFDNSERPYWRANQLLVQRNLDTTECPTGYMQVGDECVKIDKRFDLGRSYYKNNLREIICPKGEVWKKDRCVARQFDDSRPSYLREGQRLIGRTAFDGRKCPKGYIRIGKICVELD